MKKILLASATEAEIMPFEDFLKAHFETDKPNIYRNKDWQIDILVTGVGMLSACFLLANHLAQNEYDFAIQAGISGAFDFNIPLGKVLKVKDEQFGDLGAEDKDEFLNIFDLGFLNQNEFPFENKKISATNPFDFGSDLEAMSAISVNTVSGNESTIKRRKEMFSAQLESMEGIAFHYVCKMNKLDFVQIRAVSNYITLRNKSDWKIAVAIENLNSYLIKKFSV